ncbi:MAG: hypothetical protein HY909_25490 [Deltaproteobacteria bacterium]|nr:hypothetical protein [Deltaproteobacteria bacterium]
MLVDAQFSAFRIEEQILKDLRNALRCPAGLQAPIDPRSLSRAVNEGGGPITAINRQIDNDPWLMTHVDVRSVWFDNASDPRWYSLPSQVTVNLPADRILPATLTLGTRLVPAMLTLSPRTILLRVFLEITAVRESELDRFSRRIPGRTEEGVDALLPCLVCSVQLQSGLGLATLNFSVLGVEFPASEGARNFNSLVSPSVLGPDFMLLLGRFPSLSLPVSLGAAFGQTGAVVQNTGMVLTGSSNGHTDDGRILCLRTQLEFPGDFLGTNFARDVGAAMARSDLATVARLGDARRQYYDQTEQLWRAFYRGEIRDRLGGLTMAVFVDGSLFARLLTTGIVTTATGSNGRIVLREVVSESWSSAGGSASYRLFLVDACPVTNTDLRVLLTLRLTPTIDEGTGNIAVAFELNWTINDLDSLECAVGLGVLAGLGTGSVGALLGLPAGAVGVGVGAALLFAFGFIGGFIIAIETLSSDTPPPALVSQVQGMAFGPLNLVQDPSNPRRFVGSIPGSRGAARLPPSLGAFPLTSRNDPEGWLLGANVPAVVPLLRRVAFYNVPSRFDVINHPRSCDTLIYTRFTMENIGTAPVRLCRLLFLSTPLPDLAVRWSGSTELAAIPELTSSAAIPDGGVLRPGARWTCYLLLSDRALWALTPAQRGEFRLVVITDGGSMPLVYQTPFSEIFSNETPQSLQRRAESCTRLAGGSSGGGGRGPRELLGIPRDLFGELAFIPGIAEQENGGLLAALGGLCELREAPQTDSIGQAALLEMMQRDLGRGV